MQRLLVKQDGDAEPCVLLHPALDGVGVLGLCPGAMAFAGPLDPSDADTKPFGRRRARGIEPPLVIGDRAFALPEAQHLADLLFEGHAGEQIAHAAFDR